ncbi:MAG TPA: hypothetical protein VHW69_14470 [Rhizomicrobium sp.]|jgi:hypothetical protein|nr:hypothetical protein [Rhizomicrobium sp.]
MRHVITSAVLLAAIGSSALAQTTTICNQVGNTTYCNTSAPPPHGTTPDYLNSIPHPRSPSFSASDLNAMMERHRQTESDHIHQIVGQMVMAGQCSDAKATALNAGDFDLAQKVDSMCKPSH